MRLRLAAAVVLAVGLAVASDSTPTPLVPQAQAQSEARPNFLVIVTDDMRVSQSFYSVLPQTMRYFRDAGTHYTNAVATTPLCCPSRASIFSGRYAHNHTVTTQSIRGHKDTFDQTKTLQYQLGQAGYNTALAGKFLNDWDVSPPHFDLWANGILFRSLSNYYVDTTFNVNGANVTVPYSTTFIAQKTVDFLRAFERDDETPWLIFVEPFAPHKPATPEQKYADARVPGFTDTPATLESDRSDKPAWVRNISADKTAVLRFRKKQLRTLKSVDDLVSKVMTELEALGEMNTAAFFTSDNGHLHYEHKLDGKRFPYEASVRIPLFLKMPGQVTGTIDPRIVGNIDIAPTIYQLSGVIPSYTVDGKPLTSSARDHILIEHWTTSATTIPSYSAWWSPQRQYIEYAGGAKEYYEGDPWQLENRYGNATQGDEPSDGPVLHQQLEADSSCVGTACP